MEAKRVVLITGAASGIGAETAKFFAETESANLALIDRNPMGLKSTASACKNFGAETLEIAGDLTDESFLQNSVEKILQKFQKINVLVNCAGIVRTGTATAAPIEDFDLQLKILCRVPVLLSKICAPHLIKSQGNIVNVSSMVSLQVFPTICYYSMAKAALDQFTKCFALELAPSGVRVNSVNPAMIQTNLFLNAGFTPDQSNCLFNEHSQQIPLGKRVGSAREVAQAIEFLSNNEKTSFITGQILKLDGGHGLCY